jgi:hypothetical protein
MKLILLSSIVIANAQRQCATANPPQEEIMMKHYETKKIAAARMHLNDFEQVPDEVIENFNAEYPTIVHVITNTTEIENINDELVRKQIQVLNKGFSGTGVSFRLEKINRVANPSWYPLKFNSDESRKMISSLRVGTNSTLNVFFTSLMDGQIGWAQYPFFLGDKFETDGIVIDESSLPGGARENYNLGASLIHETGHWAGLYHTFEGGSCFGSGDLVDDTPVSRESTQGCPIGKNSCPDDELNDDVSNYMDYSYDSCMDHFTKGQIARMHMVLNAYRPLPEESTEAFKVESSAFEEMTNIVSEIEITVTDIAASSIAAELTTTALELYETVDKAETTTFESETLLETIPITTATARLNKTCKGK